MAFSSVFSVLASTALATERLYYIAADEVVWDYAPSYPNNPIMGELFSSEESVYLKQGDDRIGRRYLKAVYHEYTDGSFTMLKLEHDVPRNVPKVRLHLAPIHLGPWGQMSICPV
jgi:hypothetical protein